QRRDDFLIRQTVDILPGEQELIEKRFGRGIAHSLKFGRARGDEGREVFLHPLHHCGAVLVAIGLDGAENEFRDTFRPLPDEAHLAGGQAKEPGDGEGWKLEGKLVVELDLATVAEAFYDLPGHVPDHAFM